MRTDIRIYKYRYKIQRYLRMPSSNHTCDWKQKNENAKEQANGKGTRQIVAIRMCVCNRACVCAHVCACVFECLCAGAWVRMYIRQVEF